MVVLCETNVLSLISQRLDDYYQIKTKQNSTIATIIYGKSGGANSAELNMACFLADERLHPGGWWDIKQTEDGCLGWENLCDTVVLATHEWLRGVHLFFRLTFATAFVGRAPIEPLESISS